MRHIVAVMVMMLLAVSVPAMANEQCINGAAAYYGIPAELVRAIAKWESRMNPFEINVNKGSVDIGVMQINSSWLPKLAQYGVSMRDLFDVCTNIYWGTWILAGEVARYGLTWKAVGAYNAVSPHKQASYAWKIYETMRNSK